MRGAAVPEPPRSGEKVCIEPQKDAFSAFLLTTKSYGKKEFAYKTLQQCSNMSGASAATVSAVLCRGLRL